MNLRLIVLMTAMTLLLMLCGNLIGGQQGMLMALIFAAIMNFGSYFLSGRIIKAKYGLKEVDHGELYEVVSELVRVNNLPMPQVFIIPKGIMGSNAFAFTTSVSNPPGVAASEELLQLLSREELKGVMAHELTHVRNRDVLIGTIVATLAGAIAMLANMAKWAAIFGGGRNSDGERSNGLGMLAMAILAPVAAMVIQMAVSRSREYKADEGGARLCGNPHYLADALGKLQMYNQSASRPNADPTTAHMFIVSPLTGSSFASLFSTHPPVEERIARLEQMAM
ncbi:MAG: zinc metalloprotease HtpX [Deltaproteobacteria bacterium]|nr:zinc metalloprotease HtpX [Deltaproteobacteria bacterium]